MKITKTFFFGNEHTVVYKGSLLRYHEIYFDGVKCESVEMFCAEWVRYIRANVTVSGTSLQIIVFMKHIYILKDNVDIETGLYSEPFVFPEWYKELHNKLQILPMFFLFLLTFLKSIVDPTYSFINKVIAIMFVLIVYNPIPFGLDRYFIVHPLKTSKQRSRLAFITLILGAVIGISIALTLWILLGI